MSSAKNQEGSSLKSLGEFAHLDLDRLTRRGVGEVIFGEGKRPEEIAAIMEQLVITQGRALATRVSDTAHQEICNLLARGNFKDLTSDHLTYDSEARCLSWRSEAPTRIGRGQILVLTAGTSDGSVAAETDQVLRFLGHDTRRINDVGVAGLHRILSHLEALRSAEVIIVCAGMEGALSSVVAGLVDRPVIAVPTSVGYGANLGGLTALLGTLNSCAAGVVVVNIDNGFGAAYAAAQMNRATSERL